MLSSERIESLPNKTFYMNFVASGNALQSLRLANVYKISQQQRWNHYNTWKLCISIITPRIYGVLSAVLSWTVTENACGTARTQTVVCACVEDVLVHCTYVLYILYTSQVNARISTVTYVRVRCIRVGDGYIGLRFLFVKSLWFQAR